MMNKCTNKQLYRQINRQTHNTHNKTRNTQTSEAQ